jgi:hypothetical protein
LKPRGYAIVVLLAVPLLAQNTQTDQSKKDQAADAVQPTPPAPDAVEPATSPAPPSTTSAESNVPMVQDQEPAAAPEYGGPAILSRGGTASLRTPSANIKIRPYATVTGSYDTGMTPVILNSGGSVPQQASAGVNIEFGVNGFHRWRSATLGLDYKGTYRDYANNTYYNGTDQSLSLAFQKHLTRHWSLTLREVAGLLSQSNFYSGPYTFVDPTFAQAPTQEVFNGQTLYLSTLGDVTYQKSARLSFNFGGDGFLTRRRSSSLYGSTGYRARADMAYRTSRTATSGIAYDFTHFEYTKGFGGSDIHSLTLVQSFRIGRHWELDLKAGGARVENLGLTQVTIDPVIAAIIGRTEGIEVIHGVQWVPSANVILNRTLRHGSINFAYNRGVTPGNGLFLTSQSEQYLARVSYTGIRKMNFGIDGGRVTFKTLSVNVGSYGSWTGSAGVTYKIRGPVSFITRYEYRHYDAGQSVFKRESYRVSIGLGFSPKEVPLTLW